MASVFMLRSILSALFLFATEQALKAEHKTLKCATKKTLMLKWIVQAF